MFENIAKIIPLATGVPERDRRKALEGCDRMKDGITYPVFVRTRGTFSRISHPLGRDSTLDRQVRAARRGGWETGRGYPGKCG